MRILGHAFILFVRICSPLDFSGVNENAKRVSIERAFELKQGEGCRAIMNRQECLRKRNLETLPEKKKQKRGKDICSRYLQELNLKYFNDDPSNNFIDYLRNNRCY